MREVLADVGLREPNVIQPPCVAVMEAVQLLMGGDCQGLPSGMS
jgi:hypothetical protein